METRMELLIGNKAWSTWSLRAWIALKRTGQPFTETPIRLRRPETRAEAHAAGSPTGLVPVLKDGDVTVWDFSRSANTSPSGFPTPSSGRPTPLPAPRPARQAQRCTTDFPPCAANAPWT